MSGLWLRRLSVPILSETLAEHSVSRVAQLHYLSSVPPSINHLSYDPLASVPLFSLLLATQRQLIGPSWFLISAVLLFIMEVLPALLARNGHFITTTFNPTLKMMPTLKTVVISCLDPRVDPALILGLNQSDAAILRNVGGRLTPDIVGALSIIHRIGQKRGSGLGVGWNVVVMHHTDCGITKVSDHHQLLEQYLGVPTGQLPSHGIMDPYMSVRLDVAALLSGGGGLPGGWLVSGCVYDVATGGVEVVVQPEVVPDKSSSNGVVSTKLEVERAAAL